VVDPAVKFLIAGLGSIGRRHLRNLLALGEDDIVLLRTFRSTLPDEQLFPFPVETEIEAALAHRPQAVIVANPTSQHLAVAIPASRAGCHLLLEKPVSHSLDGIRQLQLAVRQGGGQVLVGFQFRFHPGLIQVHQWIHAQEIGRPFSVRAVYGEYLPEMHPWEDYRVSYSAREDLGGGVILTLCHPLDYLGWLLGEVDSLWSFTRRLNDFEITVEDTAEIGLLFSSGVIGSVNLNYNQQPPVHTLEIVGKRGTIRWDNRDGCAAIYRAGVNTPGGEAGAWETFRPQPTFERNEMFLDEMRHFLAVAKGETEPVCPLEDGIRVLKISLAARDCGSTLQRIPRDGERQDE
jgi:predicted dehydrogenase